MKEGDWVEVIKKEYCWVNIGDVGLVTWVGDMYVKVEFGYGTYDKRSLKNVDYYSHT